MTAEDPATADHTIETGSPPTSSSFIHITNRSERSLLTSAIQRIVRTFRGPISGREPEHDDGSIKLEPSKSKLKPCVLQQRTVCDIHVYDVVAPMKSLENAKKRVYYFAGGSWQTPPTGPHYQMCAYIANELADTVFSIVSMPLAPNNPAPSSFPWCMRLYRELLAQAAANGESVILAGDSSGANVVLCLALEALKEDEEAGRDITQIPHATAILAVCPSTDLTRSNPDIDKVAPRDPLLTPKIIRETAKAWYGDWDPADRRLSPINSDISLLARKGIKVHGITAGCDVLSPDGIVFRDLCARHRVSGEWVHWEKQMHCFVLTMPFGLDEAKQAVQWMVDVLKKE